MRKVRDFAGRAVPVRVRHARDVDRGGDDVFFIDAGLGENGVARVGVEVGKDRPLCLLHAPSDEAWDRAARNLKAAIRVGGPEEAARPVIRDRLVRMAAT